MSNEHLPVDHPWAGHGLSQQILAGLDQISHHLATQPWRTRLSGAMVYGAGAMLGFAGAMLAFIVAIDGYVLLRTM